MKLLVIFLYSFAGIILSPCWILILGLMSKNKNEFKLNCREFVDDILKGEI